MRTRDTVHTSRRSPNDNHTHTFLREGGSSSAGWWLYFKTISFSVILVCFFCAKHSIVNKKLKLCNGKSVAGKGFSIAFLSSSLSSERNLNYKCCSSAKLDFTFACLKKRSPEVPSNANLVGTSMHLNR